QSQSRFRFSSSSGMSYTSAHPKALGHVHGSPSAQIDCRSGVGNFRVTFCRLPSLFNSRQLIIPILASFCISSWQYRSAPGYTIVSLFNSSTHWQSLLVVCSVLSPSLFPPANPTFSSSGINVHQLPQLFSRIALPICSAEPSPDPLSTTS